MEDCYWYSRRIQNKNRTFANVFVNDNYQIFIKNFEALRLDAIFIGNYRANNKKIGNLNILKYYLISDDCFDFWENEAMELINNIKAEFGNKSNLLYVVSAGPISENIIMGIYNNNPNNAYIGFGSAIDKYIHDKPTRPYMDQNIIYAKQECWMHNPKTTCFEVSVIFNLYKRSENLQIQIEALKGQTLRPKEILLFQDAVADGEPIDIPCELAPLFDYTKSSPVNVGVWGRFKFAQDSANSKFVCIFDDDTIPGKRWLENCHFHMLEQEGLYGTIGIVMSKPSGYPLYGYYRVGWDAPLDKCVEVDFVGHSWFFKKQWLEYLFETPAEIQAIKTAGEDIAFSYELQKSGIATFVPPHPIDNLDFYGSNPIMALKLGQGSAAISFCGDNIRKMYNIINFFINVGWQPLIRRSCWYVYHLQACLISSKYKKCNKWSKLCYNIKHKLFFSYKNDSYKYITFVGITIKFKRRTNDGRCSL